MRKQRGSGLIVGVVIVVILVIIVSILFGHANTAVDYETDVKRFDQASQNTLSNYHLTMSEKIQLPALYREDFLQAVRETFTGRYGKDGSNATFQFIQENNIPFDNSMYMDLTVYIQAGRAEFKISQDRKIEICTQYDKYRLKPITKFILGLMGYPSEDVAIMCRIVLDSETKEDFSTGITEPLKLGK